MRRKTRAYRSWFALLCGLVLVGIPGCQRRGPLREIAFVSDRSGNQDIYLLNLDADSVLDLTQHQAEDWSPAWAPDGSYLAFSSTRDGDWNIYSLRIRDQKITKLTDSGRDRRPSWSPDGKKLAFTSDRDGNMDVYVINVDGSGLINVSNHLARDDRPIWSPDGKRVAFSSKRDGDWNIYVKTLQSDAVQKLTDHHAPNYPGVWFRREGAHYLLFESDADIVLYSFATDAVRTLYGGNSREGNPDRSPDGEWIVFESDRSGDNDIWCMRSDGSGVRNVTNNPAFDWYPRWRPSR